MCVQQKSTTLNTARRVSEGQLKTRVHLSRDAATEQDSQGDTQEPGEEVRRALRGDRR